MTTTIPTGYAKVTHFIACPSPGGSRVNTVTYGIHQFPTSARCAALGGFWNDLWNNIGSTESTVVKTEMRDALVAFEFSTPQDGSVSGAIVPPQVALLVKKLTGGVGRTQRGRMYLPCTLRPDDVDDSGGVKTTPLANLQGDIDDWGAAVTGDAELGELVILHSGTTELPPSIVTAINVERYVATQKRRLGRRGA